MLHFQRLGRGFYRTLVRYCNSTSLAGIGYIANRRYHWTERLFWLGCTFTAWLFAVQLIRTYMDLFRKNTVSIAVENVDTRDESISFPSVGVCEMGYVKHIYPRLETFMESLRENEDMEYNYDVEDFMLRVIFHNLYNFGAITNYCEMYEDCDDCMQCPKDGYYNTAALVRANCTELFHECRWNGKPFDCCRYFLPIETSVGLCFLLNSVQTVEKYGPNWLPLEMDIASPTGELLLMYNRGVSTNVMNEDDIPHILLKRLQFTQMSPGYEEKIFLTLQNIINDPLVEAVDIDIRRCIFPDERYEGFRNTSYRKYSYSVCATECLKSWQLKMCNCFHHNMLLGEKDNGTVCDLEGLQCLDDTMLIAPETNILLPWHTNGIACQCYPSCMENEIRVVGRHSSDLDTRSDYRTVLLKLMLLPSQRYRRQIVRESIDVVVSIGGILGLFTGASILSVAEFFYFFTVRFSNYVLRDERDPESSDEGESWDDESITTDEHEDRNMYNEIS